MLDARCWKLDEAHSLFVLLKFVSKFFAPFVVKIFTPGSQRFLTNEFLIVRKGASLSEVEF